MQGVIMGGCKLRLNEHEIFVCAYVCFSNISWNWCTIWQPTYENCTRKNIIKELKFVDRSGIFQLILTNETVRWKLDLRKRKKKHKKEVDQNGMYFVF